MALQDLQHAQRGVYRKAELRAVLTINRSVEPGFVATRTGRADPQDKTHIYFLLPHLCFKIKAPSQQQRQPDGAMAGTLATFGVGSRTNA